MNKLLNDSGGLSLLDYGLGSGRNVRPSNQSTCSEFDICMIWSQVQVRDPCLGFMVLLQVQILEASFPLKQTSTVDFLVHDTHKTHSKFGPMCINATGRGMMCDR